MIKEIINYITQWTILTKKEIEEYKTNYSFLVNRIQEKNNEISTLIKSIDTLKQEDKLNKELLERYPSKRISWNARSFPFSTEKCSVPVQVLITPTDPYIIQDLKEWKLYKTGEDYETLIPKIYKKIKEKYYKYEYDRNVWGENEVWEFPFELREKGFDKGFDCDSWGSYLVSYFRAAMLPAGKVWCVAGATNIIVGGVQMGHHTVYVWSDVDKKFHHLNSTYGVRFMCDKISQFPTHKDAEEGKDNIGIHTVWCSYNDYVARSEFTTKRIGDLIINK